MTRLSDLLNDSNTDGLSPRRIAAIAETKGVRVANTTISKYLRGETEVPRESALKAFSLALDVPMETLRQAAGTAGTRGPPAHTYLRHQHGATHLE